MKNLTIYLAYPLRLSFIEMRNALILFSLALLLSLCGCKPSSEEGHISKPMITVPACDLYANPIKFAGHDLEVSGNINIQFEYSALVCGDENIKKQPLGRGIWLVVNLFSIQDRSPAFYEQINKGIDAANAYKGGLIGKMRFRGHFTVADWVKSGKTEDDRAALMAGFGHLGAFGGQITVEEILDYQPQPAESDTNHISRGASEGDNPSIATKHRTTMTDNKLPTQP